MRHRAIIFAAFGVTLAAYQAVGQDTPPRMSATETSYLSCTIWTGKGWTASTARSARTRVVESTKGYRAYGEVNVSVKDDSCENLTRLYVAQGAERAFRLVFTEPRSGTADGNGIRLIGWSGNGNKLLAEVNFWKYETDSGFWHLPVIYDASTGTATEVRGFIKALMRHFGTDCAFEAAVADWKGDDQIVVKVSSPAADGSHEQHSCIEGSHVLLYDLQSEAVLPETRN